MPWLIINRDKCTIFGINSDQDKLKRAARDALFTTPPQPFRLLFTTPPLPPLPSFSLIRILGFRKKKKKLESIEREDDLDSVVAKLVDQAANFNIQRVPSLVCKIIKKYMRYFLWEGMDGGLGTHLALFGGGLFLLDLFAVCFVERSSALTFLAKGVFVLRSRSSFIRPLEQKGVFCGLRAVFSKHKVYLKVISLLIASRREATKRCRLSKARCT
ncbi:hypothetical protein E6C27_scaffold131G001080 [Cucumis melo var. makuwa]|uniref:Uncharacterized protein n=1 Tax=Cucumis melo var. makuwa TaxID=1194695 RepID=A0A5A7UGK8_CUCMM|nr:hypothetical protein E6C27_scaffold131G001080 [Cucumis melo var. makuwa]